jgi:YegS/Rv2252/BmrU family lipid kinase
LKYAVLFNTLSGRRSEKRNRDSLQKLQEKVSSSVRAFHANTESELRAVITMVLEDAYDVLIVSGGDGTLNRVVNSLLLNPQPTLTLAILPSGTGNSFALDLGIRNVDTAVAAIARNKRQWVDVGLIKQAQEQRYFVNNFGVGLVYDISKLAEKMRFLGAFSYTLSTLIKIIRLPTLSLTVTDNKGVSKKDLLFYEVCNSRFTGGAMMMAPNVTLTDRKFQSISLKSIPRRVLIKTFPKLFKGTHTNETFVSTEMITDVSIESSQETHCLIDGDLSFALPVKITMSPNQLSFIRAQ